MNELIVISYQLMVADLAPFIRGTAPTTQMRRSHSTLGRSRWRVHRAATPFGLLFEVVI